MTDLLRAADTAVQCAVGNTAGSLLEEEVHMQAGPASILAGVGPDHVGYWQEPHTLVAVEENPRIHCLLLLFVGYRAVSRHDMKF